MNLRFLVVVPALLVACAKDSSEIQVRKACEACIRGVEGGDAPGVIERLHPAFSGPEGMDRNGAKLFLLGLLRREKVGITVLENQVTVQGEVALQELGLVLTSRSGGGLLPQEASRRGFLLRWERKDGAWLLRELTELGGEAPK